MFTALLIVAAAQAYGPPPPAPVAPTPPAAQKAPVTRVAAEATVPGRTLKDLPGNTVTYYDIAGKNGDAIEKSLKKLLNDPAARDVVRLFSWDVGTQIVKATTGTTCTIQSAKATLTSKVNLPRLAEEANVPKDVLTKWNAYVAGVEKDAAANLWFLNDRLRGTEQSLVGLPCDKVSDAWNAKLEAVRTDLNAFVAERARTAAAPNGKARKGDSVL